MTCPVVLRHWTPFHWQQSWPFHDERRFPGSERADLKETRVDLSLAIQLLVLSFGLADASMELLVWVKKRRAMPIWMEESLSIPIGTLLWVSVLPGVEL
uniref:Uncharacterized protein n=1 Tax=Arundo donax TaxID=35708 RepID=A0A0A9A887_ARUDO